MYMAWLQKQYNFTIKFFLLLQLIKDLPKIYNAVLWQYYLIQNSPAVKKGCGPQEYCCEKRCEIQSGGQEMAVMIG